VSTREDLGVLVSERYFLQGNAHLLPVEILILAKRVSLRIIHCLPTRVVNSLLSIWPLGVAVNMPPCHGGDHGFDSRRGRQTIPLLIFLDKSF
jgi:hypothetical protein